MQTHFASGVLAPWWWNSFTKVGRTWDASSSSASQKCPSLCGTRRFVTMFTTARQFPISWARL